MKATILLALLPAMVSAAVIDERADDDLGLDTSKPVDFGQLKLGDKVDDCAYVGKLLSGGDQVFQCADKEFYSFTVDTGDAIPNLQMGDNGLCTDCSDNDGSSKRDLQGLDPREFEERDGGLDAAIADTSVDWGALSIGDKVGQDGDQCTYVGKDNVNDQQLFQCSDGKIYDFVIGQAPAELDTEVDDKTGLCKGCVADDDTLSKRDADDSLEARDAEERTLLLFWLKGLTLKGWRVGHNSNPWGRSIWIGRNRVNGYVCKGGYFNFRHFRPRQQGPWGTTCVGYRQGVQLFRWRDGRIRPITFKRGNVRNGYYLPRGRKVCNRCRVNGYWKRDNEVATLDSREVSQPEERTFLLLAILKGILGALGSGHGCTVRGRRGTYHSWINNHGYCNIRGVRRGASCGIRGGRYAGCTSQGVQVWHCSDRTLRPIKFRRGIHHKGFKINRGWNGNYCNKCQPWGY